MRVCVWCVCMCVASFEWCRSWQYFVEFVSFFCLCEPVCFVCVPFCLRVYVQLCETSRPCCLSDSSVCTVFAGEVAADVSAAFLACGFMFPLELAGAPILANAVYRILRRK
ncbi:MAG: hypothetical protein P4L40_01330 [Terracidiphilus sp.]|nr:hypothetical protein [Terracidiphilus sp.]